MVASVRRRQSGARRLQSRIGAVLTLPLVSGISEKSSAFFIADLAAADPDVAAAVAAERGRQHSQIELIASENIVSRAVLQAQGSVLTNKYAEGYPGRRYYGGCDFVDEAERL